MTDANKRLGLLLGAVLAALLALVWVTGGLSAALFGDGWRPVSLAELLSAAMALPNHLGDPRLAWPARVRATMPGAAGFYVSAALVVSAIGAGAILASRRGLGLELSRLLDAGNDRAPSARWATKKDLAILRVPESQPGRLTLGRSGHVLLAAEERRSVIVIAPTQTQKTTGFAIPALLEWEGPVLATSVKRDLIDDSLVRREQLGRVMIFDPTQATGLPRARATPLWGASSWGGAMRVAHWLAAGAKSAEGGGLGDGDFWFAASEKLLAPLLFAAAANEMTMETVHRWLDEGPKSIGEDEVGELLSTSMVEEAERAWMATLGREERQLSSLYMTADVALKAFANPTVVEETSGSDYNPAALLDGGANTLYLCTTKSEQKRLRPVFSMFVQEILTIAEEIVIASGKPLDPPLLLILDEAANVAPIPDLDEVASTAAALGIQLVTIFQDLAQMKVRFGERAATIFNNHTAKIIGSEISDPETQRYVSSIVGPAEFDQRSKTAGATGHQSTTEGESFHDLIHPSILRGAEPGSGLLVYRHLPPAKLTFRPWFADPELRRLREAQPGGMGMKEA
jgi:type IV secretion system protein VirD4